jgi:hypothetical protein
MEHDSTSVGVFAAQQHQGTFDSLSTPHAIPLTLLSCSDGQLLHIRKPEAQSRTWPSIPEGENAARGVTLEAQSEEPPAKKQRIECMACNQGFTKRKSLYRHQKRCNNTSPESYRCGECGRNCSRPDILHRHVQSTHQGRPRRRPQGPGNLTQQTSFDTAQESQGSESQPQSIQGTTTPIHSDSPFVFTGENPTESFTNLVSFSETIDTVASVLATSEQHAQAHPHTFTTPAADPNLQSSEHVAILSENDWTPDQSSISYQETSISTSSHELTPATSESSPASFFDEVNLTTDREIERDTEIAADAALAAAVEQKLSLLDVPYASAKPVWEGRNLRPRKIHNPLPCPLCGVERGNSSDDDGEVKTHLERHRKTMEAITFNTAVPDSKVTCTDCDIPFLDIRDLRRHQQSVQHDQGCGFLFDHYRRDPEGKCTGHHPPTTEGQASPDHQRFKNYLRGWE